MKKIVAFQRINDKMEIENVINTVVDEARYRALKLALDSGAFSICFSSLLTKPAIGH